MKHNQARTRSSSGGRFGQVFQFTPRPGSPGPAAAAGGAAGEPAQPAPAAPPSPGPIDLGFDLEGETFGP
jgi:hypothetical protein